MARFLAAARESMERKGTTGAFRRQMGATDGIPARKIERKILSLRSTSRGDKKMDATDRRDLRRAVFARNMQRIAARRARRS